VRAFRTHLAWGLVCLLFPPAAILFVVLHFRRAAGPLVLLLAAALLMGGTWGLSYFLAQHASLGPREKLVDGELHLTLTGWDRTDYAVLRTKSNAVVLQMANPDVTDETLQHLQGMSRLRELDLNDSQITDAGLPLLSQLPALQILRLRKTRITDQGFREHLAGKKALLELDLRQTEVASKTLRAWKAENKEHRKYLR
jgi:Leucine-rich repeat (LRR) protein